MHRFPTVLDHVWSRYQSNTKYLLERLQKKLVDCRMLVDILIRIGDLYPWYHSIVFCQIDLPPCLNMNHKIHRMYHTHVNDHDLSTNHDGRRMVMIFGKALKTCEVGDDFRSQSIRSKALSTYFSPCAISWMDFEVTGAVSLRSLAWLYNKRVHCWMVVCRIWWRLASRRYSWPRQSRWRCCLIR